MKLTDGVLEFSQQIENLLAYFTNSEYFVTVHILSAFSEVSASVWAAFCQHLECLEFLKFLKFRISEFVMTVAVPPAHCENVDPTDGVPPVVD